MTIDNSLCQQSVPKNSSWAQVNWMDHQFSGSSPSLSSPKYLGRKKKSKESATSAASSRHIITTITRAMDRPVAGHGVPRRLLGLANFFRRYRTSGVAPWRRRCHGRRGTGPMSLDYGPIVTQQTLVMIYDHWTMIIVYLYVTLIALGLGQVSYK